MAQNDDPESQGLLCEPQPGDRPDYGTNDQGTSDAGTEPKPVSIC